MRNNIFTHLSILCIILGLNVISFAQNSASNSGKIPKSSNNTGVNYTHSKSPTGGTIAYGWAATAGEFVSMPIPAGTPFTTISPMVAPGFLSSACFGPDGTLYMTDASTDELYKVDLNFGQLFLIGSTGVGGLNGITYDWISDTFFGVTGSDLYTVDVSTGLATFVGPFGTTDSVMIDIAADCEGLLWGYDIGDDMFYSINRLTGAATAVGPIGFDANFGQGMSFDYASGTLYLSAFDGVGFTGQLRSVDLTTGATTVVFDWGLEQIAPFAIYNGCGPFDLCMVEPSANPNPADGSAKVDINIGSVNWTNGTGATSIEVWFDDVLVYSGPPVTKYSIGMLEYSTTYSWRVDGSDGSCTTYGKRWDFTTAADPNLVSVFSDNFDADISQWTEVGPMGIGNWLWSKTNNAEGINSGELNFHWSPSFVGDSYLMSDVIPSDGLNLIISFKHFVDWFADPMTVGLSYTVDDGATWSSIWEITPNDNVGPEIINLNVQGSANFRLGFYWMGDSFNIDEWWIDDVFANYLVPVELTSFTVNVDKRNVMLNWSTATESNNQGFEIQKSTNGNEFVVIAFVEGNGTSTKINNYSYTDNDLEVGNYSYRLKQVDYDGSFEYSEVVEVEVLAPRVFALEQNYPNPFNPATKIKFGLPADSKVSLKIFDVLGQEVSTLVKGNLAAGLHTVNFNASNLNSGIYFYRIDATGVDGTNFSSIKKMILMK